MADADAEADFAGALPAPGAFADVATAHGVKQNRSVNSSLRRVERTYCDVNIMPTSVNSARYGWSGATGRPCEICHQPTEYGRLHRMNG